MGAMLTSESASPVCSNCRYDLTGLPQRGRCPECGSRYDLARTRLRQRMTLDDLLAALAHECRRIWVEYLRPSARTVAILVLVLGSSALCITIATLAWQALMRKIHGR